MEWTVGTALQGNKYVIQAVLSQSDAEVTYKATHTYLDQPVLLRSLNPVVRQRDDFEQVKRQFIANARSQAKQPSPSSAPILDCFEEGELPFVVLQFQPEQFSSPTVPKSNTEALSRKEPPQSDLVQAFDIAFNAATEEQTTTLPLNSPGISSDKLPRSKEYESVIFHPVSSLGVSGTSSNGHTFNNHASNGHASNGHASNGHTKDVSPESPLKSPLSQVKKLPIALLGVSLIGSCVGVGTGLALRFDAAQSTEGNRPRLSLFNREQSFPSEGNWPVQESYSPQPTIEQPIYRPAPPAEYVPPTIQTLPSETDPLLTEPSGNETKPLPEQFELPENTALPPENLDPKLPTESSPLPELGGTSETAPSVDRLPPISPENLLPPTTVTPAPVPPPADSSGVEPPPLKALPDTSGI